MKGWLVLLAVAFCQGSAWAQTQTPQWLIASPDFHHWHHAREREAWDRNFAGQLALWDFAFGTAHLPKGRQAQSFGTGEPIPADYAAQLVHPFRRPGSEAVPGNG